MKNQLEQNNGQNTQDTVEKIIDTEKIPNKEGGIFASLCYKTSNNKTNNEKTLGEKLIDYFDSDSIKKRLKNIGVNESQHGSIIKKLSEYITRYTEGEITSDKLKLKYENYFKELKSRNQEVISKNNTISTQIDKIKQKILDLITKEEDNHTAMTFGKNSPRENNDQDSGNKSFVEIPYLDLSAINNSNSQENQSLHNTSKNIKDDSKDISTKIEQKILNPITEKEENHTMTFGENSPRENNDQDSGKKSFAEIPHLDLSAIKNSNSQENQSLHNTSKTIKDDTKEFDKMTEEESSGTKVDKSSAEFDRQVTNVVNKFKIQKALQSLEIEYKHNISPAAEKLIIDLVLELEEYIENVKQKIRESQIEDDIKTKIIKAIEGSTSKESLEENMKEFEKGKEILKLMQKEQVKDEGVYSKMMSKANKVYNELYNKYYGYTNLSEQQIDEFTKNVKMKSSTLFSINDIDEYARTKGCTLEDDLNSNFDEINQSIQAQSHEIENEVKDALIDEFNPCSNLYCYATGFAISAILLAIQFMNSYDDEVLYHGFGPSGH